MRKTPELCVLVWQHVDNHCTVTQHDNLDEACEAFDEGMYGFDVIASASVAKVAIEVKPVGYRWVQRWTPFDMDSAHRFWMQDRSDDARERDRTRHQLRKDQNA